MEDAIEQAVKRAIQTMRERLGDQLTVDDMARAAMFSKFHFSRVFLRTTGVSPARFLSALRLQQAKHLLVSTSLNVADISLQVGYSSVGTFSSRFSRSVGMSPTTYRRRRGFAPYISTVGDCAVSQASRARVFGEVWHARPELAGPVFIGLFPDRIPEGRPVRCTILSETGSYEFDEVPTGCWYLLAQSVTGDPAQAVPDAMSAGQTVSVATHGPLTVRPDSVIQQTAELKTMRDLDPPVLLALLDARKLALSIAAGKTLATAA